MTTLLDDLHADLLAEAPKSPRFTEWRDHTGKFRDGGYLARVLRQTCMTCAGVTEHVEGVFKVEIATNGARRMTALDPAADWPLKEWPLEVVSLPTRLCAPCLRVLGFEKEVPAPQVFSLLIPSE